LSAMASDQEAVRTITLTLLGARAPGATVCPSEVARALAAGQGIDHAAGSWRDFMPIVHAAIDRLVTDGIVRLRWKGEQLATRQGPYRICR
jgi:hypothetical protein